VPRTKLNPPLESRERQSSTVIDTVVLHATVEPSIEGTLEVLRQRELSYHFLIDQNGDVLECVDPRFVAYHAGKSFGPQGDGVNEYSIGISFVNRNDGVDPFTDAQHEAIRTLLVALLKDFPSVRYLTTHAIISPNRKDDPLGFPVADLAKFAEMELWAD